MTFIQRIRRLETKVRVRRGSYAFLTDEELQARIVRIATELQSSGPLDPETKVFLKTNGLWLSDEVR